ncbi:hypothetical protein ALC57_09351 [Trachymyrmex cornetzi]|uniref:DNA-directed DNA polymerase n=1 Tax=Trachymyrmex cornetzi TaxID=471704 RepID=A0A151J5E8_9HYME|nr:hypothetical protein ALC57_09351 [Trachymyrmex cornetzi]
MENHERVERELLEQCCQVATLVECFAWLQRCDECIEWLKELCCAKRPRLAVGHKQSVVTRIARLAGAKTQLERRFVHIGGGHASDEYASGNERSLVWREIDAAFESRIVTGAVINFIHIEPRRFLEDAGNIVLERVRDTIERHGSVKVNTAFNGEFAVKDKRAIKSINTKNIEIYKCTDLRECDKKEKHVNLLYLQDPRDDSLGHFAWIKNLSRLVSSQISRKEHKKFFFDRTSAKLQSHTMDCGKMNDCAIRLPSEDDKWLEFGNYSNKERVTFIVYTDLECVLQKTKPEKEDASSYIYQQHKVWTLNVPMEALSKQQWETYRSASRCHICEKPFAPDNTRVRDDCHLTGRYRGFHNLSGYDAHFIIKEIATAYDGHVELFPITKEKYISFTKHVDNTKDKNKNHFQKNCIKLRFIDSFKFLSTSLEKLASYLDKNKLQIVRSEFSTLSDEKFELLTRKGVFPYEYVDCVEKLQDTRLPPRESFYSSLTGDTVSKGDYTHAVNVWQRFSIRTIGEYSDLYLKTDVLLLADIFENFRESSVASYGLHPAYYYTLPGFTWDAVKCVNKITDFLGEVVRSKSRCDIGNLTLRGGLSQCSGRYAHANNKYMHSYDPSESSSYLMYYDVNNLYGWAMCQLLPYAEIRWVKDVAKFDVSAVAPDSPTGYILEVDLEYPQCLHDQYIDLPFCPARDKLRCKRESKLLATLHDKQRYIIHYRNLQQCTRHGLHVTKIHRVLQLAIQLNTNFRTRTKNDFEKNLYKFMNNAVFGKTMENVRNHVDVKLITKWDGRYGA